MAADSKGMEEGTAWRGRTVCQSRTGSANNRAEEEGELQRYGELTVACRGRAKLPPLKPTVNQVREPKPREVMSGAKVTQ